MKANLPVTQSEVKLSKTSELISTTDLKGIVTYANQEFINISGFSAEELVGKSHNIVRHPDMPSLAFSDMWVTLKKGMPWMGIVKNRCKNGDYYWVDAYVTPIFVNGEVKGYQSVRVLADSVLIARATKLYNEVLSPSKISRFLQLFKRGLFGKWLYGSIATLLVILGSQLWLMPEMSVKIMYTLLAGLGVSTISGWFVARTSLQASDWSKQFFSNAISKQVYTGATDEIAQLKLVIKAQNAKLQTAMGRVSDSADSLSVVADKTGQVVEETTKHMAIQQQDIESVATAINEMTATVEEVARNTVYASDTTLESSHQVQTGQKIVAETIESINDLSSQIQQAGDVIHELEKGSDTIGAVVEVIQNIAEQTNLLALNAAIEAARAGDQGRGFAVVADEVRTLATRTQKSTEEIKAIVNKLQIGARQAVSVMTKSCEQANNSVEQTVKTSGALNAIADSVTTIVNLNEQIATASEEQRSVTEEINRSIMNVNQKSQETTEAARSTALATEELVSQVGELRDMTRQFGKQ